MEATKAEQMRADQVARAVNRISIVAATVASSIVALTLIQQATLPSDWMVQAAIFVAVAAVPQGLVELVARASEAVAPDIPIRVITRGYKNLGAWVGLLERPLLLGALVGGFPPFVGGWYVLKGIAGFSLGLRKEDLAERRTFQLFLINNAVSFSGVAIGLLLWRILRLPILSLAAG